MPPMDLAINCLVYAVVLFIGAVLGATIRELLRRMKQDKRKITITSTMTADEIYEYMKSTGRYF